jgi:hypothetical protein
MNDKGIMTIAVAFIVVLFFCMWVSFSERIISPGEILERAGIVGAVFAAALVAAATSHHHSAR